MGKSRQQIQDGAAYDIGVIDMRVCMKREDCIGCQFCTDVAPDVFRMNGESAECFGDGELTESNIDSATEAAEGCPVGAISIE